MGGAAQILYNFVGALLLYLKLDDLGYCNIMLHSLCSAQSFEVGWRALTYCGNMLSNS